MELNIPPVTGLETKYIQDAINNKKFSGDNKYSNKCKDWFEKKQGYKKCLLTTSCTHALEMAAILLNIKEGDEIIMPSYTFVSSANAFVLRGAKIIFVDIRPDTMNINEKLIQQAITKKTKAILVVHYAGVSCEMDTIMQIAHQNKLFVVEDAAHALMSTYKGIPLGSIGDIGCFSFHDTKNITCGEGGAIIINNQKFFERAEIIRNKGTNLSAFKRKEVNKYTWVDIGSSYLLGELNAAYLYAQLEKAQEITQNRLKTWNQYYQALKNKTNIKLPDIPKECIHNASIFYIKTKDPDKLTIQLQKNKIKTVFHYVPLHTSKAGKVWGEFFGKDQYTTKESQKLLRLPLYYNIAKKDVNYIIESIK